jgi:hypothetical protein
MVAKQFKSLHSMSAETAFDVEDLLLEYWTIAMEKKQDSTLMLLPTLPVKVNSPGK